MARYKTCIHDLEVVLEIRVKIDIYDDSMLIICQVTGEWQTKDKKLKPYQEYLTKLAD
jgi:ribonuclease HI